MRKMDMVMCTDSKCLFDLLIGITLRTEKRLIINLKGLREAYEVREVNEMLWITSEKNPADGFKKKGNFDALTALMENGKVDADPRAWIKRNLRTNKEEKEMNVVSKQKTSPKVKVGLVSKRNDNDKEEKKAVSFIE